MLTKLIAFTLQDHTGFYINFRPATGIEKKEFTEETGYSDVWELNVNGDFGMWFSPDQFECVWDLINEIRKNDDFITPKQINLIYNLMTTNIRK